MTEMRLELPPLPTRMASLPIDGRGYPVPFFVAYIDGVPDHRVADRQKLVRCVKEGLCWLCGKRLGTYFAFNVGPMCAVNRTSADPPSHRECAEYAVRACPFLSRPNMRRREAGLPEGSTKGLGGIAIKRNPGVTLVWVTKGYRVRSDGKGGAVFTMGAPTSAICYAEGRLATAEEIEASIDSGIPALYHITKAEGGLTFLFKAVAEARAHLGLPPKSPPTTAEIEARPVPV